jgi:hypothetical protein
LETEAIVVGYAMSRLDRMYLTARNFSSWDQAFHEASNVLSKPPTTFKNLRDEFDPVHINPRQGWHRREMRANRQRVLDELCEVSDAALLELVDRILKQDEEVVAEAIDSLAVINRVAYNVAERLLTGRLAEEYFLANSASLVNVVSENLLDCRQTGCGYDFGVRNHPEWAIEVKGLKQMRGELLFTEREWLEAQRKCDNYWVVVIGNLVAQPVAQIVRNPCVNLVAHSKYRQALVVEWLAAISL